MHRSKRLDATILPLCLAQPAKPVHSNAEPARSFFLVPLFPYGNKDGLGDMLGLFSTPSQIGFLSS